LQVVANDGIDCSTSCTHDGLHDVSEVVDEEVQSCAALGDGSQEAVYDANYRVNLR
jgi:hypothetical protein